MSRTAVTLARMLAALLVGFLCVRGAVAVWQQWTSAPSAAAMTTVLPAATPVAATLRATSPRDAPALRSRFDEPSAERPPATPLSTVPWHAIERSASFVEGEAGPLIAAFFDLDCAYCVQLWRSVRAPLATGRARVRWIPVAVLVPARSDRAAALLRAADPVIALAAHATRATDDAAARAPAALDDVAANNALLAALTGGRPATPVLVARSAGGVPRVTVGLPADLAAFLGEAR